MQFTIVALDGTDDGAKQRRLDAREAHLTMGAELVEQGNMWYGAALLNDDGSMKGSVMVMNFESEADFNKWYEAEPYVVQGVWKDITVHKSNTRNPWQFNHAKEWYLERGANGD